MKRLLTLTELAVMLGVSRQRVHQMVGAGKIKLAYKNPKLSLVSWTEAHRLVNDVLRQSKNLATEK